MYCQRCGQPTEPKQVDDRQRPVCTACGAVTYQDPKLAVAVIIERDGQILFGKRADWVSAPGLWSFPAGFVERGEVVEQAAIREAREETGLTIEVGAAVGVFSEPGNPVVLIAYPAISHDGTLTPADDLTALAWHSPESLPELAFGHDIDIIHAWQSWRRSRATS